MADSLNSGFSNNINTIEIRTNGAHSQRVTDRAIDLDGNGAKEVVSITHVSGHAVGTPSAPGGKKTNTISIPAGVARTVVSQVFETDGGVHSNNDVAEYTTGS